MSRRFNASAGAIQCSNNIILRNVRPFTVCAWIMPGIVQNSGFGGFCAMDSDLGSDANRWNISAGASNRLTFAHPMEGATALAASTNNGFLKVDRRFHYLSITYNGGQDTSNVKMYLDYIEALSYQATTNGSGVDIDPRNSILWIGRTAVGTWDGLISHFTYHRGRLSIPEMIANSRHPGYVRRNDLIAYLPLYGQSAFEPDLSGNGNNGNVLSEAVTARDKREPPIMEPFLPYKRHYFPYTVPTGQPWELKDSYPIFMNMPFNPVQPAPPPAPRTGVKRRRTLVGVGR